MSLKLPAVELCNAMFVEFGARETDTREKTLKMLNMM
jgi:hypothetical protein